MARYDAVTTETFYGQLNFDRKCTYTRPQDRCGLLEDLSEWNRVLGGLAYELFEDSPGKLSLRCVLPGAAFEYSDSACLQSDFLISWLLEHHRCVHDLRVMCTNSAPAPIRSEPAQGEYSNLSVRRLCVMVPEGCTEKWNLPAYTDSLRNIQKLRISSCKALREPELLDLLGRNSNSLRSVELIELKLSIIMAFALARLDNCESLKLSIRLDCDDPGRPTLALYHLIKSMADLKTLRLIYLGRDCDVFVIANALRSNVSLTMLELQMSESMASPVDLFAALKVNTTLKSLSVGFSCIGESCGLALALSLSENTSLVNLTLNGRVTDNCLIMLGEGLYENTTLEKLLFEGARLGVDGVLALCKALRTNKTLKEVVFHEISASHAERAALAEILATGDGYSRVLLPLAEPDLPPVLALLSCPTSGPEKLGQINIDNISEANVNTLFESLASSSCVKTLSVAISIRSEAKIAALCSMVRANRSLRNINLSLTNNQEECVSGFLNALEANNNIDELAIDTCRLNLETASSLTHFITDNRTINKFRLRPEAMTSFEIMGMEQVFQGIMMNPVIVEFEIPEYFSTHTSIPLVSKALRRNGFTLNRAVDFVVLRRKERRCAQAFELFSGKPCLLAKVIETTGQTELEAQLAIASAEMFLLDNYLVITGVVRRSVVCHPRDGSTQCDKLNDNCWRAIVRHLRVSDVLG